MAHRLAPAATFDLDDIWLYIAKESGSLEIADKMIEAITERFCLISCSSSLADIGLSVCLVKRLGV